VVSPDVKEPLEGREGVLYYLDLGSTAEAGGRQGKRLGGSALAQALGVEEDQGPDVTDVHRLRQGLEAVQVGNRPISKKALFLIGGAMAGSLKQAWCVVGVQGLVRRGLVLAGHDVSAGGLLTTVSST
jgi:phosphoribosylformylglycinamidine (FGAM) synthase-like enzyme